MKKDKKDTSQDNLASEPIATYGQPTNLDQVWQLFKETDKMFKETEQRFQDTDKQFKETDKRIKSLYELFTSQWGKLIESLVEGDLIKLLNQRGIMVHETYERVHGCYNGTNYEFDIIAENGEEVVVTEVKTTLRVKDVEDFLDRLDNIKIWRQKYASHIIYGAMAFLRADGSSEVMAQHKGLFVIKATGSSASIINPLDFKPRKY